MTLDTFHHFGLNVLDMDVMAAFYAKLLGTEPAIDTVLEPAQMAGPSGQPGPRLRVVILPIGSGGALELIQQLDPAPEGRVAGAPGAGGATHLAFRVSDVQSAWEVLASSGLRFTAAPVHLRGGPMDGFAFAFFADPEGNSVEIIQQP